MSNDLCSYLAQVLSRCGLVDFHWQLVHRSVHWSCMHCVVPCLYRILGCSVVVELLRALAFEKCCVCVYRHVFILELKVDNVCAIYNVQYSVNIDVTLFNDDYIT